MWLCRTPRPFLVVCITVLAAIAPAAYCQSPGAGAIEGIALDPSGAVVAGASLKVRNLANSITAATSTNNEGLFRIPVLPVGTYELSADHAGFAKVLISRITLTVGANLSLVLRFTVAGATQTVEVTDHVAAAEKSRSQLSATVNSRFISTLPANGRDFTTFVLLTPGLTRDARGGLSFGGQRAMNSVLLDGINNDDNYWGQPIGATGFIADGRQPYYISQDAVEEFQVNSNAYSAEFGRAAGGVINTVTKSGTNNFHGAAFWFYRDKSLNANDPVNKRFGLPKSPFHFNQFGATLGGPIRQDRLFFFGSYEGLRSNIPNSVFLNIPADFRLSADPVVAGFQNSALNYLSTRATSWVWPISQNDYLSKVDWKISEAHRLSGLLALQRYSGGGGLDVDPQNSFEHTDSNPLRTEIAALSLTSILSQRTVNVARIGYLGAVEGFGAVGANPEANIFEGGLRVLTIGRESSAPQQITIHQAQWSDTLHHDNGRHALKLGADVLLARIGFFIAKGFSGSYDFASLESFGRSLSGRPQSVNGDDYQQAFSAFEKPGVMTHPNFTSFAGFLQDEWRARPSLTLNLGVRYDLQANNKPPVRNPAPALLAAGLDTNALPTSTHDFAPRIGVAWSPISSGRVVVRAGYGVFYAITPSVMTSRAFFQNGVTIQTRTFVGDSPTASLIPAYPNNFCGPPDPSGVPPSCAPPSVGAGQPTLQLFSPQYRQPYVQQGSLGFEIQVLRDVGVSISYMASKGTHLQQIRDVNLGSSQQEAIAVADSTSPLSYRAYQEPRPVAGFDRILVFHSDADSIYHGLALQVNKRFSNRFEALVSYTYSKVIDDNPNVYALGIGPANDGLVEDARNPQLDRAAGDNDQRHRFVVGGVWEPGSSARLPRVAKALLGGWELSGIFSAQSGQPYSGHINYDLNNDGDFGTDRKPGLSRNSFRMPATASVDPRITRNFQMGDHAKLKVIWEAFNVLNHANIVGVTNTQYEVSESSSGCGTAASPCLVPLSQGLTSFGSPALSSGGRVMQLAIKITF